MEFKSWSYIQLVLLFLIPSFSYATQPVRNAYTNVVVSVCQPSDSNSNCGGGGGSGNVGIGTINYLPEYIAVGTLGPSNVLDVNGNLGIGTTTPAGGLAVMNGNAGIGTWLPKSLLEIEGGNVGIGTFKSFSALDVRTNTNYAYTNPLNGNIVYAVTIINPSSNVYTGGLAIVGGTSDTLNSPIITIGDGGGDKYFEISSGGEIELENQLGISMVQSGYGAPIAFNIENNSDYGSAAAEFQATNQNGDFRMGMDLNNSAYLNNTQSGPVTISTNNVARETITSAGNVGIGTTTPQGGLVVTNGNVGIGTWVPGASLGFGGACQTSGIGKDVCWGTGTAGAACIGYCTAGTFPACTTCVCC
jgi:hypothetical protein